MHQTFVALLFSLNVLLASAFPCDTGPALCCFFVQSASSELVADLLDDFGVTVNSVNTLVGIDCSPIEVSGKCECAPSISG